MFEGLTNAFVTLFVTIDPIGLAPLFLAITPGMSQAERMRVAKRAVILAFIVLLGFAFAGQAILSVLGITLPAFRIAGGLLLFWIAFEMVFEKRKARKSKAAKIAITEDDIQNIAVFPLAIPLLAGPGAISAVILLSSKASDAISYAKISGMILFVLALVYVAFLTAGHIDKVLGTTGRNVLTRLLGVLLSALAVQFVADGISAMAAA